MGKYQQIAEHVVVTFFEAVLVYVSVTPHVQVNKTLIAGAIGAGLSAVYNVIRQSTPTLGQTPTAPPPAAPELPELVSPV